MYKIIENITYKNNQIKQKKMLVELLKLLYSKKVPDDVRLLILEHILYDKRRNEYRKKHILNFQLCFITISILKVGSLRPEYSIFDSQDLTKRIWVSSFKTPQGRINCSFFKCPSHDVYYNKKNGNIVYIPFNQKPINRKYSVRDIKFEKKKIPLHVKQKWIKGIKFSYFD